MYLRDKERAKLSNPDFRLGHYPHIEIRYYKDHYYDSRRIWRLASVWFDNQPFMIIRNAGREGDDHASRFVTSVETYKVAVRYLKSLLGPQFEEIDDVVDANTNIEDLTTFYQHLGPPHNKV